MDVTFAHEPLTEVFWQEAMPLLRAHWREVAHFADIPLEPSWTVYDMTEKAGVLRLYTARDVAGDLLGYAAYFVRPNPHYASSIQAAQDVIYLDPSIRGGNGYRFVKWCDEQLRAEGVQAVYQHVKAAHDFGRMLERIGYEKVDIIYARRLDR